MGLNSGTASADYIHLYHGNAALLAESLEIIQQTSAVILAALQPPNTQDKEPALQRPAKPAPIDPVSDSQRFEKRNQAAEVRLLVVPHA